MTACCSNGFEITNFLNVADRDRANFWEVFGTSKVYDTNYFEEWWNRISDPNYCFEAGIFLIATHDFSR